MHEAYIHIHPYSFVKVSVVDSPKCDGVRGSVACLYVQVAKDMEMANMIDF